MLLLAGVAVCAWIALRDRSIRVLPPIWIPFVLWAAWAGLSLTWSIDQDRSIKEYRNEVVYTALALWMCFVAGQGRQAVKVVASVLAGASVAAGAFALYYFFADFVGYPGGAHGGAGNHSSVLLMLMPAALVVGCSWHRGPRWIGAVAFAVVALFVVSGYATLNRTVWLGFALQIILVVALMRGPSWIRTTRGRATLTVVSLVVLAAAFSVALKTQVERETKFGGVSLAEDPRFAIWTEAVEHVEERPLTGYGFGRGLLRRELTSETHDNFAWHSHNLLLDTLVQTGAPGLLLLFALLGAVVRQSLVMMRRSDALAMTCGVTLLALVVGMLVRNMTDVLLVRHIALLFWGGVGVLLACRPSVRGQP